MAACQGRSGGGMDLRASLGGLLGGFHQQVQSLLFLARVWSHDGAWLHPRMQSRRVLAFIN